MRRIVSLTLSLCLLLLGFGGSALAADRLEDNFNGFTVGRFSSGGWNVLGDGQVTVTERKSGDMAVTLAKEATEQKGSAGIEKEFQMQGKSFSIELEVNAHDGTHYLNVYDRNTSFPPAIMLSLTAGSVTAYNGEEPVEISANINFADWTKLSIYVDGEKNLYSMYVGGQLVFQDYALRTQVDRLNRMTISTALTTAATAMDVDNVKIYGGLPEGATLDEEGILSEELIVQTPEVEEVPREEIYTQDFEKMGSELEASGWSVSSAEAGSVTIEDELAGHTKVLKCVKNETSADVMLSITYTLPSVVETNCTIEMDYYHDSTSQSTGLTYIFDGAGSNPSGPAMFWSTSVTAFNGDAQENFTTGAATNKWQKIAIYVQPEEGLYDIYVDGKVCAEGLAFRNAANKNVGRVVLGSTNTTKGYVGYIDNFRIYTGTPETGEQTSEEQPSSGEAGGIIQLPELKDYSKTTTPRLANAMVLMVDKYTAYVNNVVKKIDEDNLKVTPIIEDERTLVPVRFIAENLGGTVSYDAATGDIVISVDSNEIQMTVDEKEMVVNGESIELDVPARTYHDRTMIPLRAMVEAVGKKVFWDDSGLIIISDRENIFNANTEIQYIDYVARQFDRQGEMHVPGRYSDVYLSSRWFREDGTDGQLGTLDVLKRFMATGDKWSYITDGAQLSHIANLGTTVQTAINTNVGNDSTWAQLFDGTAAVAPWMSWGAKWSCMNNPNYHEAIKNSIKSGIDNGVVEFQFDDWAGNYSTLSWGGCFCDYCMDAFNVYLKENYSQQELANLGVSNVDTFNYKEYLTSEYGCTTTQEFLAVRSRVPLTPVFDEFQLQSTRDAHIMFKEYMNEYAGRDIAYSHNVFNFGNGFGDRGRIFCYDVFDGGMGESAKDSLALEAMVSSGYLSTGIDRPFIYSPLPEGDAMETIRMGVALAYATGQYMLVPWDVWLHDDVRYFTNVEEIGDLYHFIRQYPQLFDYYEVPATVGLLLNLDETTVGDVRSASTDLFTSGVPFKDIVIKHDIPHFTITESDVKGLEYIVENTPISSLTQEEQNIIYSSGAKIISPEECNEAFRESIAATWTPEGQDIYTVLRSVPGNPEDPKIVHVLNRSGNVVRNQKVAINPYFLFNGQEFDVVAYAPGKDPQILSHTMENNAVSVTIPEIDLWTILRLVPKGTELSENYPFTQGWSGLNVGTRAIAQDGAVQTGDNSFDIMSHGQGFNVTTSGDTTGVQDQLSFVYQNIGATRLQGYDFSAKLDSSDGVAGIMIREYPSANARFIALYNDGGMYKMAVRTEDNKPAVITELVEVGENTYMRIENTENGFLLYSSADGQNWGQPLATQEMTMLDQIAGMFSFSLDGEETHSVFSQARSQLLEIYASAKITEINATIDRPKLELTKYGIVNVQCVTEGGITLNASDLELSYSSSDESIITVDNAGKVMPIAEGTANIAVTAAYGDSSMEAVIPVQVIPQLTDFINETFDDIADDELPAGWIFNTNESGNASATIVHEPSDYDKSLAIYDNTVGNEVKGDYSLPDVITEPLVVEFDFMIRFGEENPENGGANIVYTYDMAGNYATCLFASAENFWYIDNGESIDICPVEEDKWYHIKIVEYPAESCNDLYIDGELVLEKAGFRTKVSDIGKVTIGGNVNCTDTTSYYNNIRVYLQK